MAIDKKPVTPFTGKLSLAKHDRKRGYLESTLRGLRRLESEFAVDQLSGLYYIPKSYFEDCEKLSKLNPDVKLCRAC